jgi:hypothetical protein
MARNVTPASLPSWQDMTDLDRGAALLHMWKREWEGESYAVAEYPCTYFDAPALVALGPLDACAHAAHVCGSYSQIFDQLGQTEHDRLYDLALEQERLRAAPSEPEADPILDVGGYLPCGCHGTQRDHTCGPRETYDYDI